MILEGIWRSLEADDIRNLRRFLKIVPHKSWLLPGSYRDSRTNGKSINLTSPGCCSFTPRARVYTNGFSICKRQYGVVSLTFVEGPEDCAAQVVADAVMSS